MNNQQKKIDKIAKNNSDKIKSLIDEIENKIKDYQCTSPSYEKYIIKNKIKSF